jgi:glycosyltransferase involved in cell wall biosynthesis
VSAEMGLLQRFAMKVDVIVPTLTEPNPQLQHTLNRVSWIKHVAVTREKPLNVARKNALMNASTKFVAMFDDDVTIPDSWLYQVAQHFDEDVAVVSSVSRQSDRTFDYYAKFVSLFKALNEINTAPNINNCLVRAEAFKDYVPVPFFWGEDLVMQKYVKSKGLRWKTIPYFGVKHRMKQGNSTMLGIYYRRYGLVSKFALLKRFAMRLLLFPYTSIFDLNPKVSFNFMKKNIQYFAGVLKQSVYPKTVRRSSQQPRHALRI